MSFPLTFGFVRWHPRSFQHQIAVSVALLVATLALVLALALGALISRQGQADESAALFTVAQNAARLLGDGLTAREREVRVLAGSPSLWEHGLDGDAVRQALQRSQAVNPHSAWIGVTDSDGIVQAATGDLLLGVDVRQRPWFQAGLSGVHVGDVHPAKLLATLLPPGSDGGPQRFVDFAAPIVRDGRTVGVVAIHGSWDWARWTIESLLPASAVERGIEIFVFDRRGQPIYAGGMTLDAHRQAGQLLPLQAVDRAGPPLRGALARALRWADGCDCLTSAALLRGPTGANDLGWTIVARQPLDVAYAAARHGAALALALGAVAALLGSAIGAWIASTLTRPLRRIAQAAEAVDNGAAELPPEQGSIELEQLSRALSTMASRLVRARAQLEQRVAERTAELEVANARLEQLARNDPLTGLLNRRGLDERLRDVLAAARRRAAPVALMVLDADHFKRINDGHGHDAGDEVLRTLANTVRQRLRETDVVARIGGEEFVAVLPDTDAAGAMRVAAALVTLVAERELPVVGRITVSIGVAEWAVRHETAQAVLRRADQALYRAKAQGRNRAELALSPEPAAEVAA